MNLSLSEKRSICVILGWGFMLFLFVPLIKGYLFLLAAVISGLSFCLSLYYDVKLRKAENKNHQKTAE